MSIKQKFTLTTPLTSNEQAGVDTITVTATGNTARSYPELVNYDRGVLFLHVSAVAGTLPTLVVDFQMLDDISGDWHTVASFPSQNAVSSTPITPLYVTLYGPEYRIKWTVTGSAGQSFTFSCAIWAGDPTTVA